MIDEVLENRNKWQAQQLMQALLAEGFEVPCDFHGYHKCNVNLFRIGYRFDTDRAGYLTFLKKEVAIAKWTMEYLSEAEEVGN